MEKIIRVDDSLERELQRIREEAKKKMHKEFGLEVDMSNNIASKIAALKLSKTKGNFDFKIKKTGLNTGYINLL